jgi:hypothetical protein
VNWHVPSIFIELRGFLGLTGYYRKFVKNYGILAKHLTALLHHKCFQWSDSAQQTFLSLKDAMVYTPILKLPDFELSFEL